jgi:hypothetical protein
VAMADAVGVVVVVVVVQSSTHFASPATFS